MLLNEVVYNSLGGKRIINNNRPNSVKTIQEKDYSKNDAITITVDAEKLIEKYTQLKKGESGMNYQKNVK